VYYKVSLGRVNDWHVISGGFVHAPQTAIVPTPSFTCSGNAKIYNPMYNRHLEFHSRCNDQTHCFSLAGCCLDHSAGQQNNGLFILLYLRTLSASLRGYTAV